MTDIGTPIFSDPIVRTPGVTLEDYPTGIAGGTAFEQAWSFNPFTSLGRTIERNEAYAGAYPSPLDMFAPPGRARAPVPLLAPKEATDRYGIPGELSFEQDTPEPVAQQVNQLKREELQRRSVLRRARQDVTAQAVRLGAGFAASALDPINIASAFIPVVGEARYALWAAKVGAPTARLARGAIEGAAGAALVEPIVLSGARAEHADYTAADSLLNLAFGGALGGGLHLGVGWLGDKIAGRRAGILERTVDAAPPATRENALRGSIAAISEGRPVRVAEQLPELDPALAEFDRLSGGAVPAPAGGGLFGPIGPPLQAADDFFAGIGEPQGLMAAPAPRPFELGPVTGEGTAARHAGYTPIAPADRPWFEGAAAEVSGSTAGYRLFQYNEDAPGLTVTGEKSTAPEWFKASGWTREQVATAARKALAGEPLGAEQGRIVSALFERGRNLREENARQMVAHRDARQDARRREIEQLAADDETWFLADDRDAAAAAEARTAPTLRAADDAAADSDAAALEVQIDDLASRLDAERSEEEAAYLAEADEAIADVEAQAKAYDVAATCLLGEA